MVNLVFQHVNYFEWGLESDADFDQKQASLQYILNSPELPNTYISGYFGNIKFLVFVHLFLSSLCLSVCLSLIHTHAHAHTSSVNIYKETSLCYVLRIPRYAWLTLHKYLLTADCWTCSLVPKDVKFLGWRNRRYSLSWKGSSLLFRMSLVGPLNLCFFPARNIHSERCWVREACSDQLDVPHAKAGSPADSSGPQAQLCIRP